MGVAPLLIDPRTGAIADRIGDRVLVVTGSLLLAVGMAGIAATAAARTGYPVLIVPMSIAGAGLALVMPAATRSVTSTVPPADIGAAAGAFATMRQLSGAFGVAALGAVFAATGGYTSAGAFRHGFVAACAAAAGVALAGAAAGTILPGLPAAASSHVGQLSSLSSKV